MNEDRDRRSVPVASAAMFVKICGITSEEDALLAVAMDADAIGFVFAPSKRQIAPSRARDIARRLPPEVVTFGVFRDESADRVVSIVNSAGLRGAQLHGHESIEAVKFVGSRVPFVIKAFGIDDPALVNLSAFEVDYVMVDGAQPGSGNQWDYSLLPALESHQHLILAGGLNPENVATAVEAVGPWGVDVSSGVERAGDYGGRKDPSKVRRFVLNARNAQPSNGPRSANSPYDWTFDN